MENVYHGEYGVNIWGEEKTIASHVCGFRGTSYEFQLCVVRPLPRMGIIRLFSVHCPNGQQLFQLRFQFQKRNGHLDPLLIFLFRWGF
jgi:hypothetical protein